MGPFQIVSAVRKPFETKVEECLALAEKTDQEKCEEWDRYMIGLGLMPMSHEERKKNYSLHPKHIHGALPIELKQVLGSHVLLIGQQLQIYRQQYGHEPWWTDRVEKPLTSFVEELTQTTLNGYIGQISASGIFKNAEGVMHGYFDSTIQANAQSHQCPTCGAARPAETDYRMCHFCGADLF